MFYRKPITFDPARNNFDLIRIVAAFMVAFAHVYSLAGAPWDPLSAALHYGYAGTLGVMAFFVISGFLVGRSQENNNVGQYLLARCLRILPGLVLITAFETLIVAPVFYQGRLSEYFQVWAWPHFENVFIWPQNPTVPNVFVGNAHPQLNGSLWTIPIESAFYLILPIMAVLIAKKRVVYLGVWFASLFVEPLGTWVGLSQPGPSILNGVTLFHAAQFFSFFMAGLCAWKYRDLLQFSAGWFFLSVIILFAARDSVSASILLKFCLPYVVLFLGVAGGIGTMLKRTIGDLSYGTYIFAYPLTNIIVTLGRRSISPEIVFLLLVPTTLIFAYFSWRFVEAPFLRIKIRVFARDVDPEAETRVQSARRRNDLDSLWATANLQNLRNTATNAAPHPGGN